MPLALAVRIACHSAEMRLSALLLLLGSLAFAAALMPPDADQRLARDIYAEMI